MIGVESQNASLIQIAQQPLRVEMKNVWTPVIVLKMLIAHLEITEEYANVVQDLRVIHMGLLVLLVRNLTLLFFSFEN